MTDQTSFKTIDFDSLEAVARQRDGYMFEVCTANAALFLGLRRMLDQVSRQDLLDAWMEQFSEYFPRYHHELQKMLQGGTFETQKAQVNDFVGTKAAKNKKLLSIFRGAVDSMM